MIEESALVVSTEGDHARLEIDRRSSCGACAASGACGGSLFGKWLARRPLEVRAKNPVGACPGEWVVVGLADEVLTQASLIAYLTPVLSLILGAGVGQAFGGELAAILGGGSGILVGLVGVARFSAQRRDMPGFEAVILRRSVDLPLRVPFG